MEDKGYFSMFVYIDWSQLPVSDDKNVSSLPGTGEVPFSRKNLQLSLGVYGGCQRALPVICCLISVLSSK